jgi:hypothetical protein
MASADGFLTLALPVRPPQPAMEARPLEGAPDRGLEQFRSRRRAG